MGIFKEANSQIFSKHSWAGQCNGSWLVIIGNGANVWSPGPSPGNIQWPLCTLAVRLYSNQSDFLRREPLSSKSTIVTQKPNIYLCLSMWQKLHKSDSWYDIIDNIYPKKKQFWQPLQFAIHTLINSYYFDSTGGSFSIQQISRQLMINVPSANVRSEIEIWCSAISFLWLRDFPALLFGDLIWSIKNYNHFSRL